jgi:hypothetical protein
MMRASMLKIKAGIERWDRATRGGSEVDTPFIPAGSALGEVAGIWYDERAAKEFGGLRHCIFRSGNATSGRSQVMALVMRLCSYCFI